MVHVFTSTCRQKMVSPRKAKHVWLPKGNQTRHIHLSAVSKTMQQQRHAGLRHLCGLALIEYSCHVSLLNGCSYQAAQLLFLSMPVFQSDYTSGAYPLCIVCAVCLEQGRFVRQCYSVSFSCYVLQALVVLLHLPQMCQLCSVHCHCWAFLPSSCWPAKTLLNHLGCYLALLVPNLKQ